MNRKVKLGLTPVGLVFIGSYDESKHVLKDAFRMSSQVANQKGDIQVGMVNPLAPYVDKDDKGVPEMHCSEFLVMAKPNDQIEEKYLETVTGLDLKGKKPKTVSAKVLDGINFRDRP